MVRSSWCRGCQIYLLNPVQDRSPNVVTPLVRGGAQVLHGDQIVELSVLLEVHEREEKEEDGEGQIEVEDERGELKERRARTWMT